MKVLNFYKDKIPEGSVYIGRPSKWGNPFIIGRDGDREQVIKKYEKWILSQPKLMNELVELTGKDLVCYCSPKACHGDVLKKLIENSLESKE
jgi:hypothetical protein